MKVPFLDLKAVNARFQDELEAAALRVLRSGWYVLGDEVAAFEQEFAAYCGASHCVGLSNGLDALHLILRALDIGPGDEVIVPANTFIATWLAVSYCGATPVPVEPETGGFNIDPARIEAAITARTKAIMVVHLYGMPASMAAVNAVAARHGLPVIEDAAQAQGAALGAQRTGVLGTVAAFSFYPGKNLGAFGDAGAVTTNDAALAERIRVLRNYGSRVKYQHEVAGYNARLDELQAALLRVRLRHLDADNADRRRIAAIYHEALEATSLAVPPVPADRGSAWHLFVVAHPERDRLQSFLAARDIHTVVHYPVPPHLQGAYRELGYESGAFPLTERWHDRVLSLPLWPGMPDAMVNAVIQACHEF
ncbi:MAG TPA: DegT/DnrJ/EryC1/StrS family aminotransferase [Moraxellaceae bacterium]